MTDETQNPGTPAPEPTPEQAPDRKPTIELAAPITEALPESMSKFFPLVLSTHTAQELDELGTYLQNTVDKMQEERAKLVTNKVKHDFVVKVIGYDQNGKELIRLMTPDESLAFNYLNLASDTLKRGPERGCFRQGEWSNAPRTKAGELVAIGTTNTQTNANPATVIRQRLGIGEGKYTPLFTSGFSLSFTTPGTMDQLLLQAALQEEKIARSRDSSGFALTSSACYINQVFTDWVLKYVDSSTAGTTDPIKLKQLITLPDLDSLAVGIASTIWPKGYVLERYCAPRHLAPVEGEDPVKVGCGHVEKYLLNVNRMMIERVDNLSEDQLLQVYKRKGLIDPATIKGYQEGLRKDVSRIVDLNHNGLVLRLRIPTLYQAERVSTAWIDRLTVRSKKINAGDGTSEARENFLTRAHMVGRLMGLGHWIEAIGIRDRAEDEPEWIFTRTEPDPKDIELQYNADAEMDDLLEDFAANNEACEAAISKIRDFINAVCMSTAIITKEPCPNCGEGYEGDDKDKLNHENVISVNALELFFTLLALRIQQSGG